MLTIKKTSADDFKVLTLTDFQLSPDEWELSHKNGAIIEYTLTTLFERVKPDLVTVSGDLAWCGDLGALEKMASSLDRFGVPYAIVWGNHDQDGGKEKLADSEKTLFKHPLFMYERGPDNLGYGNYVINIEENGKIIHSLIMMDSHDHVPFYNEKGEEVYAWGTTSAWGKLYPEQVEWYKEQIDALKEMGSPMSSLIMHIPCFAYREAYSQAYKQECGTISIEDSYKNDCWNEGYEGSFGVLYEGICSHPGEDGVFKALLEKDHTKDIIVGHDHKNCFSIPYKGIRFTYGVKTGAGCYWDPNMNGGTVLKIEKGKTTLKHEFVDVSHLL